ncbi:MAG: AAA family ATPase [Candidatus Sungbacteria bacterium]|nr:AAA family ATPase [Candidatus Sungbacteria bacterium]
MKQTRQRFTKSEQHVRDAFIAHLKITKRKTAKPVVVAMIGLVGSGKSFVARELAPMLGATIIEYDRIRIQLRKAHLSYDHVAVIAEDAARVIILRGGNVIPDSDFVDRGKQAVLRHTAREIRTSALFVRVTCDPDIMVGRILASNQKHDLFFRNASSSWKGPARQRAAVVKIREMLRRIPHHYRWSDHNGGTWELKKLSPLPFAEIDTGNMGWRHKVTYIAKQIYRDV